MTTTKTLKTLAEVEKELIIETMDFYKGNLSDAAKSLQIDRSTLYGKIERLNLKDKIKYGK